MADQQFTLTGKMYFPSLSKPNQLTNKFQLNLVTDEETQKKLASIGVQIRNNPKQAEQGDYVILESKNFPPKVVDENKEPIPTDQQLYGQGSEVKVVTHVFETKDRKGVTHVKLGLDVVQVLKAVPYQPKSLSLLDE